VLAYERCKPGSLLRYQEAKEAFMRGEILYEEVEKAKGESR
jgi:hypothetical protein